MSFISGPRTNSVTHTPVRREPAAPDVPGVEAREGRGGTAFRETASVFRRATQERIAQGRLLQRQRAQERLLLEGQRLATERPGRLALLRERSEPVLVANKD